MNGAGHDGMDRSGGETIVAVVYDHKLDVLLEAVDDD